MAVTGIAEQVRVIVESLGTDSTSGAFALVRDTYGNARRVSTEVLTGGGTLPQPGEAWVIERINGTWVFSYLLVPQRPEMTGPIRDISVERQVIDALSALGLVVDQTTPTSVPLFSAVDSPTIDFTVTGDEVSGYTLTGGVLSTVGSLTVVDTPSIDLSLTGTRDSGYTLSATTAITSFPATGAPDLNTILTPGMYWQSNSSSATAVLNYPELQAGVLEVLGGTPGVRIWQRYTVYQDLAPHFWVRSYRGVWSAWYRYDASGPGATAMNVGDDLNNAPYTSDGRWTVDSGTVSNSLINWPVEAIPRADKADANNATASYRGSMTGTLITRTTSATVEQEAHLLLVYGSAQAQSLLPVGNRVLVFRRFYNSGAWRPWTMDSPTLGVITMAEREALSKALAPINPRTPLRIMWDSGLADARAGWSSPFEQVSMDGIQWWREASQQRQQPNAGWTSLPWGPNLSDYTAGSNSWSPNAAARTSAGIIIVKGLASNSAIINAGALVATLPPGMRPATSLLFTSCGPSNNYGIVYQVNPNGQIIFNGPGTIPASQFLDLNGIMFPAADVAPASAWTALTLENSWTAYQTATYGTPAYWQDALGRVWFRGVVTRASDPGATDSRVFTMPAGIGRVTSQCHGAAPAAGSQGTASVHWSGNTSGLADWVFKSTNASVNPGAYNTVGLSSTFYFPVNVIPDTLWRALSYFTTNGWADYGAGFPGGMVWTAEDGIQHFRGLVKGTAATGNVVSQATVAFGTNDKTNKNVMACVTSSDKAARLTYETISPAHTLVVTFWNTGWISLDGLHYWAELA